MDTNEVLVSHQSRYHTKLVKDMKRPKMGPVAERLTTLLDVFSPWDGISLTYRQFAAELGTPVTEAAIKKWPRRKHFPVEVARRIVTKAQERGIEGVSVEWLLWGEGNGPKAGRKSPPGWSISVPAALPQTRIPTASKSVGEPHGRFPETIAEALRADLSHNEFGQWSSVEVQHTVLWALKDLARRLRVLRFDMGKTFELTDDWAGRIGLPVRTPDQASEEADEPS
jgi:hypothetical protein